MLEVGHDYAVISHEEGVKGVDGKEEVIQQHKHGIGRTLRLIQACGSRDDTDHGKYCHWDDSAGEVIHWDEALGGSVEFSKHL